MTYVTMQDRIADEVYAISTASASGIGAKIKNAIQSAIKHYERKRFYFNQKITTFSTVAAQEYYGSSDLADIPGIVTIDAMTVTLDSSVKCPILARSFQAIDADQSGQATGDPEYFAYWDQRIRLFPIPNRVRTVTVAYLYRPAALSADGDTNDWLTEAEEMIRQRAKLVIALDVTRDDNAAARARQAEMDAFAALRAETARRMSSPRLTTGVAGMIGGQSYNINRG